MGQEIFNSHITKLYTPEIIKKLYANALLIDIDDNNEKVGIIEEIVGPEFAELGPGTNRLGLIGPDGFCHKIALDRRGIVDNITEFKRSPELDWVSPMVYETNGVILVAENVELITKEDFQLNRESILDICKTLAQTYIFTDIGFATKNFCNWGIRKGGELVVLDTGYMLPILGNEDALICPVCGSRIGYNSLYTHFTCRKCNNTYSFIDIYRRMTNKFDDELFQIASDCTLPDMNELNNSLYNNSLMKGGHLRSEQPVLTPAGQSDDGDVVRIEDLLDILSSQQS